MVACGNDIVKLYKVNNYRQAILLNILNFEIEFVGFIYSGKEFEMSAPRIRKLLSPYFDLLRLCT